jgi:segregation and condensation protein A
MNQETAKNVSVSYQVATPIFDGPLDLLLYLIEKSQLDITKISLSMVTNQFLDYLQLISNYSPENLSEFLVIASKLLQIKSESILPKPSFQQDEDGDPGELLAKQLLEYRKFKNAAGELERLEKKHQSTFLRITAPTKIEGNLDLVDISVTDILFLASNIFGTPKADEIRASIISPRINIRDKILFIHTKLTNLQAIKFSSLIIQNSSYLEIVVTFLAILELMKMNRIIVEQTSLFSDFFIKPSINIDDDDLKFELEFD